MIRDGSHFYNTVRALIFRNRIVSSERTITSPKINVTNRKTERIYHRVLLDGAFDVSTTSIRTLNNTSLRNPERLILLRKVRRGMGEGESFLTV